MRSTLGWVEALYERGGAFRRALERCDQALREELEVPLLEVLYGASSSDELLKQTAYAQPALFALEYALSEQWSSWGVRPAYVMGHSLGEYVAACVSGALELESGLRLVAQRGRLMQSLPEAGSMLSAELSLSAAQALVADEREVAIAAHNGARRVVLSGSSARLQVLQAELTSRSVPTRWLVVSHAFHSPLMEPMQGEFGRALTGVELGSAKVPLVSNLTGQLLREGELTADCWLRQMREPVQFHAGLSTLRQAEVELFLELGPHPTLSTLGLEYGGSWTASLRRDADDWTQMLRSLATLHVSGVPVDWAAVLDGRGRKLQLPTYAFERKRFWIQSRGTPLDLPALGRSEACALPGRQLQLSGASEHFVLGPEEREAALAGFRPATPYGAEAIALVLVREALGRSGSSPEPRLLGVTIHVPLLLAADASLHTVITRGRPGQASFENLQPAPRYARPSPPCFGYGELPRACARRASDSARDDALALRARSVACRSRSGWPARPPARTLLRTRR